MESRTFFSIHVRNTIFVQHLNINVHVYMREWEKKCEGN